MGQLSEQATVQVGVHLLHNRKDTMGLVRLEYRQRTVRGQHMVAIDGEQLALVGGLEVWDAPHDQPGGDLLGIDLDAERRELDLGDLGVAVPAMRSGALRTGGGRPAGR